MQKERFVVNTETKHIVLLKDTTGALVDTAYYSDHDRATLVAEQLNQWHNLEGLPLPLTAWVEESDYRNDDYPGYFETVVEVPHGEKPFVMRDSSASVHEDDLHEMLVDYPETSAGPVAHYYAAIDLPQMLLDTAWKQKELLTT